jgi:hypothetical protein
VSRSCQRVLSGLVAQFDLGGGQRRPYSVRRGHSSVGPQVDQGLHDRGERLGRVAKPDAGRPAEPDD